MSNNLTKYNEQNFYFNDDLEPQQKINSTLTENQAVNILNNVSLKYKDVSEELDLVIKYIRNGRKF